MKKFSLYVILDKKWIKEREAVDLAEALVVGGADLIQYRNKLEPSSQKEEEARRIREALRGRVVSYIVNDDPALAARVGADGVHLGPEDSSVTKARALLGAGKIIGVSARSVEEARVAEQAGADYVSVGDLFGSQTKTGAQRTSLSTFSEICRQLSIPVIGIGGITLENLKEALSAGASAVAVSQAILDNRDVAKQTRAFKTKIDEWKGRKRV